MKEEIIKGIKESGTGWFVEVIGGAIHGSGRGNGNTKATNSTMGGGRAGRSRTRRNGSTETGV